MNTNEPVVSTGTVLSTENVFKLMNTVGVVVEAVLLKADGTTVQVAYDTTPKQNHAQELLSGLSPTIIGEYDDINVILVRGKIRDTSQYPVNQHKLRFPFDRLNDTIHGDIFLYRLNKDAKHESFTVEEYQQFIATPVDPQTIKEINEAAKLGETDQKPDSSDSSEPLGNGPAQEDGVFKMNTEYIRSVIVSRIKKDFPSKFGREPTEQEIQDFYERTLRTFATNFTDSKVGTVTAPAPASAPANVANVTNDDDDGDDGDDGADDEDGDEDYDPAADEELANADAEEDAISATELEEQKQEFEKEAADRSAEAESENEQVDSPNFTEEFEAAIRVIQQLAVHDREKILDKARQLYKSETGNEPTEEQLADAFSLMKVNQVSLLSSVMPYSQDQDEDKEDEDYDPTADQEQANADEAEDELTEAQIVEHQQEFEKESAKVEVEAEPSDELQNDPNFSAEFKSAIENIQQLAIRDRQKILEKTRQLYVRETGDEPTEEQLADAFSLMKVNQDSILSSVLPHSHADVQEELQDAMDHVRALGRRDRDKLADDICGTFEEINGRRPNEMELHQIFARVKHQLQLEAEEQEDDTSDDDGAQGEDKITYVQAAFADVATQRDSLPTVVVQSARKVVMEHLRKQCITDFILENNREPSSIELDSVVMRLAAEMFGNLTSQDLSVVENVPLEESSHEEEDDQKTDEDDDEDEDEQKQDPEQETEAEEPVETETVTASVKVLTTPFKKKTKSARYDIYFEKPSEQELINVQKQFAKTHNREPSREESLKLTDFVKIEGVLEESTVDIEYEREVTGAGAQQEDEKENENEQVV